MVDDAMINVKALAGSRFVSQVPFYVKDNIQHKKLNFGVENISKRRNSYHKPIIRSAYAL